MTIRLKSVSECLVNKLSDVSSNQRKKAIIVACADAVNASGVSIPIVDEAIEKLRRGELFSAELVMVLINLSDKLDFLYFDSQEKSEKNRISNAKYLKLFSQARAVSALALGGSDETLFSTAEAIYEASMAVNNQDIFINNILSTLSE